MRFTAMFSSILKLSNKVPTVPSWGVSERTVRECEMQSGDALPKLMKTSVLSSAVQNDRIQVREELERISHAQRRRAELTDQPTSSRHQGEDGRRLGARPSSG